MPYATNVYYGVPGRTNGRPFPQGGAVPCNSQTFGDPAPGQAKSCWYAPRITAGGSGGGGGYGGGGVPSDDYDDRATPIAMAATTTRRAHAARTTTIMSLGRAATG